MKSNLCLKTVLIFAVAIFPAFHVQAQTPASSLEATPAPASDDGTSGEELEALQKALGADVAQDAAASPPSPSPGAALQSMNPDMALVLDVALAAFSVDAPLQEGGHDPTATGFNLQQLEMSLASNVDPFLAFNASLVFSEVGVEIEEAYASTLALPANLKVRGGLFLSNFGRFNNSHPHAWHFVDQNLVNGKFLGGEGDRGLGAELSYLAPLPWYLEALVSAHSVTEEHDHEGEEKLSIGAAKELAFTGRIKQFFPFTKSLSLQWGVSAQAGPYPGELEERTLIVGTDLYLRFRPVSSPNRSSLSLDVELMHRSRETSTGPLEDQGGSAQLVYQINAEWETGVRLEAVSGVEDDPLNPDWTSSRRRTSFQVTFYPSHFSRLRLEGSADRPTWLDEPIYAGMLALEVVVGAHGAHAY